MITGLAVKTADGEILGIVRTDTKHESLVKRDVEGLIMGYGCEVVSVEYDPESIEYTTTDTDGMKETYYVEDVQII